MTASIKSRARHIARAMPSSFRKALGYGWDYISRIWIWFQILSSIRGVTFRDQILLLSSATCAPFVSLKALGSWRDPLLFSNVAVSVSGFGRFNLRARTDDLWHVLPYRESTVVTQINKHLVAGDVFVDAGANIGVYSVLASRLVGAQGHVLAIEMMPDTAAILKSHIELNSLSNVSVIENALADQPGSVVTATLPQGQCGQATIMDQADLSGEQFSVTTTTLDELLRGFDSIALLKLDVEGVEELVLQGGVLSLPKIKRVIFEDWGSENLSRFFTSKDFDVTRLDGNNCLAVNRIHR